MKKLLITGATGYLGANVAARFAGLGFEVHALVRDTSDLTLLDTSVPAATVHRHDGETQSLAKTLADVMPDLVIHMATHYCGVHQSDDLDRLIESNLRLGCQLADAMARAGVTRLINTGTSWQRFRSDSYCPANLYAATKEAFEALLEYYLDAEDFSIITLTLFDSYGPSDPRRRLIPVLLEALSEKKTLRMSPGEQQLDLVHVDDITSAFETAATRLLGLPAGHREAYSVNTGEPKSLRDIIQTLASVAAQQIDIEWGGLPYREREIMVPWAARKWLPGWRPKVGLEEGFRQLLAHDV